MLENDWTIFVRVRRADPGVLVELFGEIDVRCRRPLEDALSHCLVSKRSKLVDLVGACGLEDQLHAHGPSRASAELRCYRAALTTRRIDEERNRPMRAPYVAVSPEERSSSIQTAERYAKYKVCDPRGRRIGRTEKVFANGRGEPEYIRVKMGLFGLKIVLLPVQSVAVDEERRALVLQ
jgi:hypothetical protein